MALVKPKDKNRIYPGLPERLPAYCGDFDDLIDAMNEILDGTYSLTNLSLSGTLDVAGTSTFTGTIVSSLTTDSTSSITGAIKTAGGLGVAKALFVGTSLTAITSVITDTISERTSAAGVTVDSVLLKDGGVSNSAGTQTASFTPITAQNNITAGTGGAIIVTNYLTTINTDAGGDAFSLANGTQIGQLKKILLVADGGGDAVITPVSLSGGTTITMNDATDFVILKWTGSAWIAIENFGCTIA